MGKKDSSGNDPRGAVIEFQKAAEAQSTPEITKLRKTAQQQAQVSADRAAVAAAVNKSNQAESEHDYITAFEGLDTLPAVQRTMANDRLETLRDRYVQSATDLAKQLQRTHSPIKGVADEVGIQRAYGLLQRGYDLTSNATLQDQVSVLGDSLSAYYLQQARHYLERPDGTGANVGWFYLQEAKQYKASNINEVGDEITRATPAHRLRSRLSIRVTFRDQTSRREAVAFAEQLTDAMATGLESAGLNIKVVRPNETTSVLPNFELIGDVVQNSKSNPFEGHPKESQYRSGEQPIPNEEWNAVHREWDAANQNLQTVRQTLQGSITRGKKKEIAAAQEKVSDATKKVGDLQLKLDSLPATRSQEIKRTYAYTEQVHHLKAIVELQFRVTDSAGAQIFALVPILKKSERSYIVLAGVKGEDTTGVRAQEEAPDETQFLEEAQYDARDTLLREAKEKVSQLPGVLLQNADRRANDGDLDGAAELYLLYLGSTDPKPSPERRKAERFLLENYNFRSFEGS